MLLKTADKRAVLNELPIVERTFLKACLLPVIGRALYASLTFSLAHPTSSALLAATIGLLATAAFVAINVLSLGTASLILLGASAAVTTTTATTLATAGLFAKRVQRANDAARLLQREGVDDEAVFDNGNNSPVAAC